MQTRSIRAAIVAALLAAPGFGQIFPGHSIATVTVTNMPGEMYDIDHLAGTATPLTLSATLAAENPNCVLMTSPVTGYVGTNASPTGNIYSIVVSGGTVMETLMNTTPTLGANIAQLVVVGNKLYFCSQNAGVLGALQSVPLTGGAVTLELDISTVGATGLANACAAIGNKVYVATFNSSPANTATSPCEVIEFDTVSGMGRLVLALPAGGFAPSGNPWNAGIVNMHEDPLQPGILALQGVYGDLIHVNPVTGTVVSSTWTGVMNAAGTGLASGTVNSFFFDLVAQDWVVGTRYGSIERWVDGQQAEQKILGVGSAATTTQNSIGGLYYFPAAGGPDVSYGPGCPGNGGWTPTDSSYGSPSAGNMAFRLACFSMNPGDPAILIVDFQNQSFGGIPLPIDLTSRGAPGCLIRSGGLITLFAPSTGSGAGGGRATVALPIPGFATGLTLYRQWVELQVTPSNTLGVAVSNARQMTVQ